MTQHVSTCNRWQGQAKLRAPFFFLPLPLPLAAPSCLPPLLRRVLAHLPSLPPPVSSGGRMLLKSAPATAAASRPSKAAPERSAADCAARICPTCSRSEPCGRQVRAVQATCRTRAGRGLPSYDRAALMGEHRRLRDFSDGQLKRQTCELAGGHAGRQERTTTSLRLLLFPCWLERRPYRAASRCTALPSCRPKGPNACTNSGRQQRR